MNDPILRGIADNPALFDAVKKVLTEKFEASFSTKEFGPDTSNETLGQYLRAKVMGLALVEEAFKDIAKHKSPPPPVERLNEAR